MPRGSNSEQEISLAVLRYLAQHKRGEASISEIISALPRYLSLNKVDLAKSETRENEQVWEQRVRNIVSHNLVCIK